MPRQLIKNDIPEHWQIRTKAGLCPVCGKDPSGFEKNMRVYCSKKCREKYASKYTTWDKMRKNVFERDGHICACCGITTKSHIEESRSKLESKLNDLLSNKIVLNVVESLRADALIKLSEEYEKNFNDIMDDVVFIKRIKYNKMLPDSVRNAFRPPKPVSFEVDHKLAIVNGGDEWDMDNLQILCVDCHRKKTKLDMKISKFGDNNGT